MKASPKLLEINANWTHLEGIQGWRHYRIAGRRRREGCIEVEVMAVCDRQVRFWLGAEELRKGEVWRSGWV